MVLTLAMTWHFYLTSASLMISFFCTNSCGGNGSIGRSRTQIAEHPVAIEQKKNSCFNFSSSTAISHTHNGSKKRVLQQQGHTNGSAA